LLCKYIFHLPRAGTFIFKGLHQVSEGYVGVYWRGGALLPTVSEPGFHVKIPMLTTFAEVQTTVQTDSVEGIPCGTSGGVMINFDKVEVVNRLQKERVHETIRNYTVNYDKTWIFDKIHSEINQFCSSHTLQEVYITLFDTLDEHLRLTLQRDCDLWAPGIEVIAVRVTKPSIPEMIRRNFELMEAEKTKLIIAVESQKVAQKEAETKRLQATIEANMYADVSRIEYAKKLMEMESKQRMESIQDDISRNRVQAAADAMLYSKTKEAEANAKLLTSEFLQYTSINLMTNVSKIYFGEKIPTFFVESVTDSTRTSTASSSAIQNNENKLQYDNTNSCSNSENNDIRT